MCLKWENKYNDLIYRAICERIVASRFLIVYCNASVNIYVTKYDNMCGARSSLTFKDRENAAHNYRHLMIARCAHLSLSIILYTYQFVSNFYKLFNCKFCKLTRLPFRLTPSSHFGFLKIFQTRRHTTSQLFYCQKKSQVVSINCLKRKMRRNHTRKLRDARKNALTVCISKCISRKREAWISSWVVLHTQRCA